MMAKMFYTIDEAKSALAKNEEEIKQLTREGRLREFRDGPRLMFKADQVEALKAEFLGEDKIELTPMESGAPLGLSDSRGGSVPGGTSAGSAVGSSGAAMLSGTSLGSGAGTGAVAGSGLSSGIVAGSGMGSGAVGSGVGSGMGSDPSDAGSGAMTLKEDTALAADLGLSGSIGGMPSPSRGGSMHGSRSGSGVDVLHDDDSVERVDPSAQTAISSGLADQINVESVGSGSGLLDLSRERDDTSLGAELLDEIAPGAAAGEGTRRSSDTVGVSGLVDSRGPATGFRAPSGVDYVERADPWAAAYGGAALGAAVAVVFGAFALVSGLLDNSPGVFVTLSHKGPLFLIIAGSGIGLAIIFFVVGMILGKTVMR